MPLLRQNWLTSCCHPGLGVAGARARRASNTFFRHCMPDSTGPHCLWYSVHPWQVVRYDPSSENQAQRCLDSRHRRLWQGDCATTVTDARLWPSVFHGQYASDPSGSQSNQARCFLYSRWSLWRTMMTLGAPLYASLIQQPLQLVRIKLSRALAESVLRVHHNHIGKSHLLHVLV